MRIKSANEDKKLSNIQEILLTEYIQLGNEIRERHNTIWHVRYVAVLAVAAIVTAYSYIYSTTNFNLNFYLQRVSVILICWIIVWLLVEIRYNFK